MRFVHSMLIVGCLATVATADIVQLNDGSTLEGDVKKSDAGWVVTTAAGKVTTVRVDEVKSIQKTPSTKPSAVNDRLSSLRRAMENVSDIQTIIDRYQRFIDQAPDDATKKAAQEELVGWKQKQQQGLVKFGSQWINPGDRAKIQEEALGLADQSREYLKQGRLKEAGPILQKAISIDPGCASAHYLRGLLFYRQDQLAPARKEFEAVAAMVPDHVPTLNNLAIVIGRQNQVPAALNQYDRAMIVSPSDRGILTNVAEVLEALSPELRKNEIVRRVQRRFDEQIAPLETKLASEGLYRWGATWVTAADLEKLKAVEAANKAKLDALSVQFDAAQAELTRIAQSIADNQNTMRRIESESIRYDVNGQPVRVPYPAVYYELVRDNQRMTGDRAALIAKMEQMRVSANTIKQQLPTPRFTGVQQMIGVEGTPVLAIVSLPTTVPTTQPIQSE